MFCTVILHKSLLQDQVSYISETFAPAKSLLLLKDWFSIILDLGLNSVHSKIPFKLLYLITDVHLYK